MAADLTQTATSSNTALAHYPRPKVGRRPLIPQNDEGQTIEPQVSDPSAKAASAADTAAP